MLSNKPLAICILALEFVGAHLEPNYPQATWQYNKEIQDDGGFCGGGARMSESRSFSLIDGFVSVSGDSGDVLNVYYVDGNNAVDGILDSKLDFPNLVISNVQIPPSGNLCMNVTLPQNETRTAGSSGIFYFETHDAKDPTDDLVSICSQVSFTPEITQGQGNFTSICSNGTIASRTSTCKCECRRDDDKNKLEAHCIGDCTDQQEDAYNAQCKSNATAIGQEASAAHSTGWAVAKVDVKATVMSITTLVLAGSHVMFW